MASTMGREIHLAARPHGWPSLDDFAIVDRPVPTPAEGQVLVRNHYLSVDPYMRGRMNDVESYVPPFRLDEPMEGAAIGEVVESGDARHSPGAQLSPGDLVLHNLGWREYAVAEATAFRPVDPAAAPTPSAYLGILGMPGLTAYVGLLDMAALREGDTVFVSGAAGAVGSAVGQIARARGASRVIGSAGTPAKVRHLVDDLGFDTALCYRDGPVATELAEAAPDGIDVYFDNVGGDHLEAAISAMRPFGRLALCGAISIYNATEPPPGPRNLALAVGRRLTLRGFIIGDHFDRFPDFVRDMAEWLRTGAVRYDETVIDGIDHAPDAFLGMLRGENTGKTVVRL